MDFGLRSIASRAISRSKKQGFELSHTMTEFENNFSFSIQIECEDLIQLSPQQPR